MIPQKVVTDDGAVLRRRVRGLDGSAGDGTASYSRVSQQRKMEVLVKSEVPKKTCDSVFFALKTYFLKYVWGIPMVFAKFRYIWTSYKNYSWN